jgi:hypothetical protein
MLHSINSIELLDNSMTPVSCVMHNHSYLSATVQCDKPNPALDLALPGLSSKAADANALLSASALLLEPAANDEQDHADGCHDADQKKV